MAGISMRSPLLEVASRGRIARRSQPRQRVQIALGSVARVAISDDLGMRRQGESIVGVLEQGSYLMRRVCA